VNRTWPWRRGAGLGAGSLLLLGCLLPLAAGAAPPSAPAASHPLAVVPGAVWDGIADAPHPGWIVIVSGGRIEAVGPADHVVVPADAERIVLPGTTLIPGLIEGHSHLFPHPYNETRWDD